MSGNVELIRSLEGLRLKVGWMFAGYAATGESSWVEHQALVDAISRGDADGAAEISRQHIAGSASPTSTCSSNALRSPRTTAATLR